MWNDFLIAFVNIDVVIIIFIILGALFSGEWLGIVPTLIISLCGCLIFDVLYLIIMLIGRDFTSCEKRCREVSLSYRYKCENVCNGLSNHSNFDGNLWYYNMIQDEHDRIEGSVRDLWDMDNGACQYLGDCHAVCSIKGNISIDNGEKIYHMPGCSHYKDTVINSDYGEKYFCTEEEAQRYGWRKCIDY